MLPIRAVVCVIFSGFLCVQNVTSFVTTLKNPTLPYQHRSGSTRRHALTPTGPFCPFRSEAAVQVEPRMEKFNQDIGPEFSRELTQVQKDMQSGQMPNPDRLRRVARGMLTSVEQWQELITRLRLSGDFQTREYAKLTQAHLDDHGVTVETIGAMMKWQAQCMMAMADNTMPPMPPPEIDLNKMMKQAQDSQPPSINSMTSATKITCTPFTEEALSYDTSDIVREEYRQLCRDHMYLVDFGATYDSFDPLGKIAYLDEMQKIEERWDVFYTRFSLMGKIDQEYIQQCNRFLSSMGLNEEQYRRLLKKTHDIMRADAEAERSRISM